MANIKISELVALTVPAAGDYFPIVDASEALPADQTKRITLTEHANGLGEITAAITSTDTATDDRFLIYDLSATTLKYITRAELGIDAGTAFPASPSTGQRFFRTDLGLDCYYDGTRWLTTQEYMAVRPQEITATDTNDLLLGEDMRNDFSFYATRIAMITNVSSANSGNDGSHYWTVAVRSANLAYNAFTTLYTFDTSADTVSTYTQHGGAASTNLPGANNFAIDIRCTKTGTPGVLISAPTVFYRLVIT